MGEERDEVYERIPWETLEKRGGDRQWMVYAVAGAIALGALAYSFTRNQPVPPPQPEAAGTSLPTVTTTLSPTSPSTVSGPLVVSEADLYAVDPGVLARQAEAHGEWVAVEYISFDGSEQSDATLGSLLPRGVPLPEAPAGTQVFVDWAGLHDVTETEVGSFEVTVLVRSLAASGDAGFVRQPPRLVTVPVEITEEGPRVTGVPSIAPAASSGPGELSLEPVTEETLSGVEVDGEPIGAVDLGEGGFEVVTVISGRDGVSRPVAVRP